MQAQYSTMPVMTAGVVTKKNAAIAPMCNNKRTMVVSQFTVVRDSIVVTCALTIPTLTGNRKRQCNSCVILGPELLFQSLLPFFQGHLCVESLRLIAAFRYFL